MNHEIEKALSKGYDDLAKLNATEFEEIRKSFDIVY